MDANNEFDKLVKDKLAKGNQKVPAELKGLIESRLVREGLIKKSSGNGKWLLGSFSVIAILAILAGGYYYVSTDSEMKSDSAHSVTEGSGKNIISEINSEKNETENVNRETMLNPADHNPVKNEDARSAGEDIISSNNSIESKPGTNQDIVEKNAIATKSDFIKVGEKKDQLAAVPAKSKVAKKNKLKVNNIFETDNSEKGIGESQSAKAGVQQNELPVLQNKSTNLQSSENGSGDQLTADPADDLIKQNGKLSESNTDPIKLNGENGKLTTDVAGSGVVQGNESTTIDTTDHLPVAVNETSRPSTLENGPATVDSKRDSVVSDSSMNKSNSEPSVDSLKKDSAFISRYSIEAFAGLQFTMKQGASYTNSKGENLNKATNSEVIVGLKLNYFINKFSIGAGLNYSKHSSQIPSVYNTFYIDTSSLQIPISLSGTITTDYSIIDIPVLVGYNFRMNKFSVHVESGISFSLISDATSLFALEDTNIVINNFSMLTPEKSYMNYVGQVSFLYSLSKNLQVMIQPSFNYGLSGIFKEIPEEKINVFSLKGGLRLNF